MRGPRVFLLVLLLLAAVGCCCCPLMTANSSFKTAVLWQGHLFFTVVLCRFYAMLARQGKVHPWISAAVLCACWLQISRARQGLWPVLWQGWFLVVLDRRVENKCQAKCVFFWEWVKSVFVFFFFCSFSWQVCFWHCQSKVNDLLDEWFSIGLVLSKMCLSKTEKWWCKVCCHGTK